MMTNLSLKLATMFIVALASIGTAATAFAQSENEAIETADRLLHENVEPEEGEQVSKTDIAFHQALCQVGISTEALEELGGCDILPPIGQSDDD